MRYCLAILGLLSIALTISPERNFPFGTASAIAQTQDAKANAEALLKQCRTEVLQNNPKAALVGCQNAAKAHQQIGDRIGEGTSLSNMGAAYTDLKRYPEAMTALQEALSISREYKDPLLEARALNNLAFLYSQQQQYQKSITTYQEARKVAEKTGDRELLVRIIVNLGRAYSAINRFQDSIAILQKAIELCQSNCGFATGKPFKNSLLAVVQWDLGNAYSATDQYQKAIESHEKALKIYRANSAPASNKVNQIKDESDILGNIGINYVALGQYQKGLDTYQQALALIKDTQDIARRERLKRLFDDAYRKIGYSIDFIDAEKLWQDLKARQTQPPKLPETQQDKILSLQSKTMAARAIAFSPSLRKGQEASAHIKEALEAYEELLAIARERGDQRLEAETLQSLGSLYNDLKQLDTAIKTYEEAIVILKNLKIPQAEAESLRTLSDVYAERGQIKVAIQLKLRGLKIWQSIRNRRGEIAALYDLGVTFLRANDFPKAQFYLNQAMGLLAPLRQQLTKEEDRVVIVDTQVKLYSALQQAYVSQKNYGAALEVAERSRAQTYAELLAKRISDTSNPTQAPITIKQLQDTAKQQNATIIQYSVISGSRDKLSVDSFDEDRKLREQLKLKDLPAYTIRSDSSLFIWVIQPNGTLHFRQVELEALSPTKTPDITTLAAINQPTVRSATSGVNLSQVVAQSRSGLGVDPRGRINIRPTQANNQNQNELRQLYDLLIKPIENLLPDNPEEQVIFVPQGSLFLVPFATLQDAKGQMLIDKHTLRIAPSVQVVNLTHQQSQRLKQQAANPDQSSKTLVVGNPVMPKLLAQTNQPPAQLSPLPGAEKEAREIGQLLNTKVLTAEQATETAVRAKMPAAQVIHLATHGLLDYGSNSTIPGAIALTPSTKDDGFLTSSEIVEMKLQANLVVLSACDTGRGKITGDGVIGLSRSLMTAGVPSVVVSLWAVPDAPTAELMTEFYKQLQRNPDKAQALRQAMLKIKAQYPNPRDWAAFTLMGQAN